jgi:putative intracellular protease/amidase
MSSALVNVTAADGTSIFKGKPATGFSNAEEEKVGKLEVSETLSYSNVYCNEENRRSRSYSKTASNCSGQRLRKQTNCGECVPLMLYSSPFANVAVYTQPKVVHAGNLITGQNPASARPIAQDLMKKLQARA